MVPFGVLAVVSAASAGSTTYMQGELHAGFVRSATVAGVGTDAKDAYASTGLGLQTAAHLSLIGLMRGGAEGFQVLDWWGGEIGVGSHLGRGATLWYEMDFDFGMRFGVHEEDGDLYVTPLVRTGNFRGHSSMGLGNQGVPNAGFGVQLAFRGGPLVVELELPKPHAKGSEKSWTQQTSLAVGAGELAKHLVRWELTAVGDGTARTRQTTLMYVFRMG